MSTLRVYNVDSGDTNNLVLLGNGSVAATISGTTQAVNFAKSPSINGSTSGAITLAAPAVAGTNTITFPAGTGTAAIQGVSTNIVSGTVQSPISGTSIDFTGIPSWVKRVTVMFNGVSTNGTSNYLIQLGTSAGVETTGYFTGSTSTTTSSGISTSNAGFILRIAVATASNNGAARFNLLTGNTFAGEGTFYDSSGTQGIITLSGVKTLSSTLDRVRITTANGTDTFDAGTINILYE